MVPLSKISIAVKGAGEMASASAWRLHMANFKNILMLETDFPLAVRREVSFCEAVHEGEKEVEKVKAVRVWDADGIRTCWETGDIALMVDPHWQILTHIQPEVLVDGVLAKINLGTHINEAPLVVGLGPGFWAGKDVHLVIETNRGHNLGRIVTSGQAERNTGIPGAIGGFAEERVLRAPGDGKFLSHRNIGDMVVKNEVLGSVSGIEVRAGIDGVLRGLIRPSSTVTKGMKIGDIDPRGDVSYCFTISDKARAIGGSVLEAILRRYNRR